MSDFKSKTHFVHQFLASLFLLMAAGWMILEMGYDYWARPSQNWPTAIAAFLYKIKPSIIWYGHYRSYCIQHPYLCSLSVLLVVVCMLIGIRKIMNWYYHHVLHRLMGKTFGMESYRFAFVQYSLQPILIAKMEHCLGENNEDHKSGKIEPDH